MILRHAGGAAARCLAASSSARAPLPLPQLLLPRQLQLQLPRRSPQARRDDAPSHAVASSAANASASASTSASASASASTLTPADRHAIIDLIHRFDDCLNRGRHDEIGAFFVGGDGGANSNNGGGSNERQAPSLPLAPAVRVQQPGATSLVAHEGIPAIVAFFRACAPMARGNRHLILNSVVDEEEGGEGQGGEQRGQQGCGGTGPAARVRSSRLLVSATNPPVLRASGVIEDVVVRAGTGGRWRLLSRDLIMDPPAA